MGARRADPSLVTHVGLLGVVVREVEDIGAHVHECPAPRPDDNPVIAGSRGGLPGAALPFAVLLCWNRLPRIRGGRKSSLSHP